MPFQFRYYAVYMEKLIEGLVDNRIDARLTIHKHHLEAIAFENIF